MKLNIQSVMGIAAVSFAGVLNSAASTITYDFGLVSGGATPAGSPPWVQAVFTDVGMPADTVQLTLTAGNLTGSAFVNNWYFNFDPTQNPDSLTFTVAGSTGSFTGPSISTGANAFKAGPDGKFDILFGFVSTGDNSTRFTGGDSLTYTISGISGLTADDFNQISTACAGGSGSYSSAANVQSGSVDVGGPGWINPTIIGRNADTNPNGVPDGSATITLLGVSLVAIEAFRRKMQTRSAR